MRLGIAPDALQALIYQTVDCNGMRAASGVHIRVMVTRGLKPTPYQNPKSTIGAPTIVIIPEWKQADASRVRPHTLPPLTRLCMCYNGDAASRPAR